MIGIGEIIGGFTGAKMRLLMIAGAIAGGGLLWNGSTTLARPETMGPAASAQESLRSPWGEGTTRKEFFEKGNRWSDNAIRLGVSFTVAMVIGSLLRVAVKTMVTLLIGAAVIFWILQSQGIVEPAWEDYYGPVSEGRNWLTSQLGAVGGLLGENLPSAGAALIGFGFGLRK